MRHLHMHVFPRFAGNQFTIDADRSYQPARTSLDGAAAALQAASRRLFGAAGSAP